MGQVVINYNLLKTGRMEKHSLQLVAIGGDGERYLSGSSGRMCIFVWIVGPHERIVGPHTHVAT